MSNIIKDAVTLFLITLIAGLCLGAVNEITTEPRNNAHQAAANATYREVYPDGANFASSDEIAAKVEASAAEIEAQGFGKVSVDEVLVAQDASGAEIGHVVIATSMEGYGGAVQIAVGITNDGTITGLGFPSTLSETPGLGMKATEPEFRNQFPGMEAKDDITINAISGASHTSGAVTGALKAAVYFANHCMG